MAVAEKELLSRVREGDGAAYYELVADYRQRLYRKACSMLQSPDDAEDILQEALLTAYRAIHKFRGDSSFYTWIYRIVVNKCRDHYRSQNTRKVDTVDPSVAIITDDRISQEKNLELSEDASYLIGKINGLEKKYREILIMRYYDDLSYQEIAAVLRINQGTVKSRLFKARELLKRSILGNGRGEEYFHV
ncbi:MAG: RNA polymerase sigma factor [Spirochaetales bacterium]|nr:RNA polymerase sigma factor [Spirochaetales bacterium]